MKFGYRSIITFILHSQFSIFNYPRIFCSVYLSEQLCYTIYEIVSARLLRLHGSAELTLYGDGCDAVSEHLIRAALRVRRQYFPGLLITFVEIGSGQGQNIAKYMAARQDITYLE